MTAPALFFLLVGLVVCNAQYQQTQYRTIRNNMRTQNNWQMMGDWQFNTGEVYFYYRIDFPEDYRYHNMMFYREDEFNRANSGSMDCRQRTSMVPMNQFLNFSVDNNMFGSNMAGFDNVMGMVNNVMGNMGNMGNRDMHSGNWGNSNWGNRPQNCNRRNGRFYCNGYMQFRNDRPWRWYAVVSRCNNVNGRQGINFNYEISNNRQMGDNWGISHTGYPFSSSGSKVTLSALLLAPVILALK